MLSRKAIGLGAFVVAAVLGVAPCVLAKPVAPRLQKKAEDSIGIACPATLSPADRIACYQTLDAVVQQMLDSRALVRKLQSDSGAARTDSRAAVEVLPSVASTFEAKGKQQAVLVWGGDSGGSLTVSPGEKVPGGWTVQGIHQGVVRLRRGGETRVLLLSSGGGASAGAASTMGSARPVFAGASVQPPTMIPGFGAARPAPGALGGR